MTASEEREAAGRQMRRILAAALLPALAWALQLQLSYALVPSVCAGMPRLVFHAITVAALIVAGGGAYYCWRAWRDAGRDEEGGRAGFVAIVGSSLAAMFALVVVAQSLPILLLHACD